MPTQQQLLQLVSADGPFCFGLNSFVTLAAIHKNTSTSVAFAQNLDLTQFARLLNKLLKTWKGGQNLEKAKSQCGVKLLSRYFFNHRRHQLENSTLLVLLKCLKLKKVFMSCSVLGCHPYKTQLTILLKNLQFLPAAQRHGLRMTHVLHFSLAPFTRIFPISTTQTSFKNHFQNHTKKSVFY